MALTTSGLTAVVAELSKYNDFIAPKKHQRLYLFAEHIYTQKTQKHMGNFYLAVFLIAILGIVLSLAFRKKIAEMPSKIKPYTRYLYWTFILIVIEELVSCTPGSGCPFQITVPILFLISAIYGLIIKSLKAKSVFRTTLIFMGIGLAFELLLGTHNAQFAALKLFEKIIILAWGALSYAFMVIIPLTILTRNQKRI